MKTFCKLLGIILVLFTIYFIFQTNFVINVVDKRMYDGFGIELISNGISEKRLFPYNILVYVVPFVSLCSGLSLIKFKKKEN